MNWTLIGLIVGAFLFLFFTGIIASHIGVTMPYGTVSAWDVIIDGVKSLLPSWLQAIL